MVGFNRRFSPLSTLLHSTLKNRVNPLSIHIQVNAGFIPEDHWVHESKNGGRFIGEGCHFIDLIHFFTDSKIISVHSIGLKNNKAALQNDTVMAHFECKDGSIAAIHYLGNGNKRYPKEKITIFSEGHIYEINNWKKQSGRVSLKPILAQQKGHHEEIEAFLNAIQNGGTSPISFNDLCHTTHVSFAHVKTLETGNKITFHNA